jgi:hypothetical protein
MGLSLVTLAEYKAYVGITSTTQDVVISSIIPKVSQLIKNVCRRSFVDYVDDAKEEILSGGPALVLQEGPILAITAVEYSTDFGKTYSDLVEFDDYVLDIFKGVVVPVQTPEFTYGVNRYKVSYTSGYEVLPVDLKLAVLDLVTYYIKNDAAVHSPKAPGTNTVQIEYITTTSLPAHIKRVLDLYTDNYA